MAAFEGETPAALCGASADGELLWQVGIDVLPPYRSRGLGRALVEASSARIVELGKVPFYGTAAANVHSQGIAVNCGFFPAWVEVSSRRVEEDTPETGTWHCPCGLACCLCSEADHCAGCDSGDCLDKDRCENRACSLERGVAHCFRLPGGGLPKGDAAKEQALRLYPVRPAVREEALLDCLERNEKRAWSTTGRASWGLRRLCGRGSAAGVTKKRKE